MSEMQIARPSEAAETPEEIGKSEVVPALPWMARIEQHRAWSILSQLPVAMSAEIPLIRFRVKDLLALTEGQVFETGWPDTEDVPLKAAEVQIGWTEFEVVEQKIALRLTRLF